MLYSRRDSGEVQCSSHEFLLCCITFYVPGHHDMLYTTPSWQALLWGTTKSPLLPLLVALCRLILSEVNVISSFFQRRGLKPYSPLTCSNYAFTFRFQSPHHAKPTVLWNYSGHVWRFQAKSSGFRIRCHSCNCSSRAFFFVSTMFFSNLFFPFCSFDFCFFYFIASILLVQVFFHCWFFFFFLYLKLF